MASVALLAALKLGGQQLRLLSRANVWRDLEAKGGDAVNGALGTPHRLIDEVDEVLALLAVRPGELHGHLLGREGLTGRIDAIQERHEAQRLCLGRGLADWLAQDHPVAEPLVVAGIGQDVDMLRPAEQGDGGGRLHQQIPQAIPISLCLVPGLALALEELGKRWLTLGRGGRGGSWLFT